MGDSVRWGPSEQVQLDSAPAIGDVSRTPLQDLVLPKDSTTVSRFLSPKETLSLETDSLREAHLLKILLQGNEDEKQ